MNHDFTLLSMANRNTPKALPPDILNPREHIGDPAPRAIRLRRQTSGWLYRLAERIAPRPARAEPDELFAAIAVLLAEPISGCARLEAASQQSC